jgi:hypothetical protein
MIAAHGKRKALTIFVTAAAIVICAVSFKREYVVPSDGLLAVRARERGTQVIVTGALKSSGAKITKTTLTRHRGDVLVRVYAAGIGPTDKPQDCVGTFSVAIPRTSDVHVISVGESAGWMTVGEIFQFLPVRLPRLRNEPSAVTVVWAADARTSNGSSVTTTSPKSRS